MKINHMKFIDKYLGFFICMILSFINKFLSTKKINGETEIKKILLMKFWGLGSILLLSPTVEGIRKKFCNSKIIFLTLSRNEEICNALRLFDEIITLDVDNGWFKFLKTLFKNILFLWRERFDIVIDFEFFTRFSAIITFLTFAKIKIGYHAWETWRGNLHNIKVPFNRYWHILDNFYNLGNYLGLEKQKELKIVQPFILEEDKNFVEKLLKDNDVNDDFISIHVNASDLIVERRWPYENFISLINQLLKKNKIKVIFIGSKSETNSVKEILSKINNPNVIDFVGKLSITQLAYLFKKSKLVISNDSGPLHLAVAINTPTVSFFGPETPLIYGPKGENHTVFFKNIDCSPCINIHDRKSVHCYWARPKCMDAITVEEVLDVIEKKLK